ncbi:YfcL family protein [Thalassotalea aquiviva]|uniref:YfcL family protein n=1 Tax=Thalassotalea aquiviva TaxID=3242415 RepID=UPI00352B85D0
MRLSTLSHVTTIAQLWAYFDTLVEQDNDDLLFVSSYLRGFIEVAALEFGGEQQRLSADLYHNVSAQLTLSQGELSPSDINLVNDFWGQLKPCFK